MTLENADVTAKISASQWSDALLQLRAILLDCGLTEALKWNSPCYSYDGGNVLMLYAMKNHVAIGFFKGSLLSDPNRILQSPGENSQASRLIRFDGGKGISQMEPIVRAYVKEAIGLQISGARVDFKRDEPLDFVQEIRDVLAQDPELKEAFDGLTRGRQRGYNIYVSQAKQAKTRLSRFHGYRDRIMAGKGVHDCICGLSKKMPRCDGSHTSLKG